MKLGKQISAAFMTDQAELSRRVAKMRRKFAQQYGFILPEIRITDDLSIGPKRYQIAIHGTIATAGELRIGDVLVVTGDGQLPDLPCDITKEPAFGMKAVWVTGAYSQNLQRNGFKPIDPMSVLLTHLAETIRGNLAQLLSYKDMRTLISRLEPEYRKLIDEIIPSQISASGLQAVLRLLLAERVSIRNLYQILEAVAEIVPHVRRTEQIVEHVRVRLAQQVVGDLLEDHALNVVRLGTRWDMMFHKALKRGANGEIIEFDVDPRLLEQFGSEMTTVVQHLLAGNKQFVVVTAPEARPYVRMVTERLFPMLPVLSHLEITRGVEVRVLGSVS